MAELATIPAPDDIADILTRVTAGKERVILTRNGLKVAAVVPLDDVQTLELIDASEDDMEPGVFERAREEFERGETIPHQEVKRRLGMSG